MSVVVPIDFFGAHIYTPTLLSAPPKVFNSVLRLWDTGDGSQNGGGGYNKIDMGYMNPSNGVYNWVQFDAALNWCKANGYKPMFTFGYFPGWQNGNTGTGGIPTSYSYLYTYCDAVLARLNSNFPGLVRDFELWNEWDLSAWWQDTVSQMVTTAQVLAGKIRAAIKGARIISPATTAFNFLQLDAYIKAGGIAESDVIAFHSYPWSDGHNVYAEQVYNTCNYFRAIAKSNGYGSKSLWCTEGSFVLNSSFTTPQMIVFTAVYNLLHASAGLARSYWYQVQGNSLRLSGNLINTDGSGILGLQPQGVAYREVQKWLAGATFTSPIARVKATNQIRNGGGTGSTAGILGSGGALPTNWTSYLPDSANGITAQIIGSYTEGSQSFVRVRFYGTPTGSPVGYSKLQFESNTQISGVSGQTFNLNMFVRQYAGSTTNVTTSGLIQGRDSSQAVTETTESKFPVTGGNLIDNEKWIWALLANGTTANACPQFKIAYSGPIDITLDIGAATFDTSTVWTGALTEASGATANVVWDQSGGPSSYSVPGGMTYYRDLTGSSYPISNGTVTLTGSPILLESASWGFSF